MKDLFASYKLALKLKEKGFDEPCIAEYIMDGVFSIHAQDAGDDMPPIISEFTMFTNSKPNWIPEHFKASAPMYAQVINWLIDKHGVKIDVKHAESNGTLTFTLWKNRKDNLVGLWERIGHIGSYQTMQETLEKGIEEALNLI